MYSDLGHNTTDVDNSMEYLKSEVTKLLMKSINDITLRKYDNQVEANLRKENEALKKEIERLKQYFGMVLSGSIASDDKSIRGRSEFYRTDSNTLQGS